MLLLMKTISTWWPSFAFVWTDLFLKINFAHSLKVIWFFTLVPHPSFPDLPKPAVNPEIVVVLGSFYRRTIMIVFKFSNNANHSSPKAECFLSCAGPTGRCPEGWVSWRMAWLVKMISYSGGHTDCGQEMTMWVGGTTVCNLDMWRWSSCSTDKETSPQWRWEWKTGFVL